MILVVKQFLREVLRENQNNTVAMDTKSGFCFGENEKIMRLDCAFTQFEIYK